MKDGYFDFDGYIIASELHKREKAEAWKVVDHRKSIEGLKKGHRRISE